jgi:hypothetical protein
MDRRIGRVVLVAVLVIAPSAARAFSLGETGAAMGMQGTLAQGSASNVAGTLNTVRNAVNGAAADHNAQIEQAEQNAWNAKSGPSRWASNGKDGGGKGWTNGGSWQENGRGGGGWVLASKELGRGWSGGPWGSTH